MVAREVQMHSYKTRQDELRPIAGRGSRLGIFKMS
jgi:hypothetical protein